MKKAMKIAALSVVALLAVSLAGVGPAGAHGGVSQAGYEFVFGAMDEPMLTGQRTWLELRVNDAQTKEPVQGLEEDENLTVTLVHGTLEKTLPIGPVRGTPGSYKAAVWFTQAGEYPAVVRGNNADGEPFELEFTAKVSEAKEFYGPSRIAAPAHQEPEEPAEPEAAAPPEADVTLKIGEKEIWVNGESRHMDVAPVIIDSRTMVPWRFIVEALGMEVHWDAQTRTVHVGPMAETMDEGMEPEGEMAHAPADETADEPAGGHVDAAPHEPVALPADGPDRTYTMKMFIRGFMGVDGAIDGINNPELAATVGEVIKVDLVNGDPLEHDFVIDELGAHTDHVFAVGEKATTTFEATQAGSFYYYCSVPGHRKAGMEGIIEVTAN